MNFSEFKEKLGAEPRQTAAELAQDIARDPKLSAATDEALGFENKLEQALGSPRPGSELLEEILTLPHKASAPVPPVWLAIAASLLLVVGLSSALLWQGSPDMPVEEYVNYHYGHDGQQVLAMANERQSPADVAAVFASLGVQASPELSENILYIKFCPTPQGQGAHMVVKTADGPVTIIYMPLMQIDEPLLLTLDQNQASVIGLQAGAAAIIGGNDKAFRPLEASLRAGLKPLSVDA